MKRSELLFDAIRLPADFLFLVLAGVAAYAIRVSPTVRSIRPVLFAVDLPLREYLGLVVGVAAAVLLIFAALGLYAMKSTLRAVDEFTRIIAGITLAIVGVVFLMFIRAEFFNSRFILVAAWALAIVFVATGRTAIRWYQAACLRRGIGVHRVLLVGDQKVAGNIARYFARRPELGYHVIGVVGHLRRELIEEIRRHRGLDEIIRTGALSPEENLELLDFAEDYKVDFTYVPDLYETRVGSVRVRTLGGYPLVELRRTPLEGWGRVWKRVIDQSCAAAGLALLAPLFGVLAVAILADTGRPVFFRQVRVGRDRQPFRIVKFRTMVQNAEALKEELLQYNERPGPLFKMRNDPRVTRVGRWLRRWRLDEFPQLVNVFKGQMSLIGPRPHLPEEIVRYAKHHRKLFTVKPGMTGLAQVSGSSSLPFEEEATLDIHYVEHWSPKLDAHVFLKTIRRLLGDRSAV